MITQDQMTISQAIALAKQGTSVFQFNWGGRATYLAYRNERFFFDTYKQNLSNLNDCQLLDSEEIDEITARLSLYGTYLEDKEI